MDGFVAFAMEEERQLSAALSKNPIYIKLEAVRALLRAYAGDAPATEAASFAEGEDLRTPIRLKTGVGKSTSVAGQVRSLVIPYLRETGTRVQSNKILEFIQDKGVVLGGQNPIATLSSYLSGTPELDNIRGQGYGLKEWSEPQLENSPPSDDEVHQVDDDADKTEPSASAEELFG